MSAQSQQSTAGNTTSNSASSGASQTNPWSVQVPYLTQAFQGAGSALNNSTQFTPDQLQLYTSMLNSYQNPTLQGASTSSAGAGSTASGAGAGGITAGISGLEGFNPSSTNNTNANIAGGNAMVTGSNIPGQVAADMVPAEQAAAYGLNPQIDQNAAGSGNINSSRDAIEHGVLASNLAQQSNALSSQLGANEFNTGVQSTSNTNTANNTALGSALSSLLTGSGYGLNSGTAANSGAVTNASGLYGIASGGASGQNTDPYQSLLSAMGVFGGTGYGSSSNTSGNVNTVGTSNSTTTYDPSQMSQIGAWTNLIGSIL